MERLKGKGLIIVVSAPSGAGKKAVLDKVRAGDPNLCYSVSATTRDPRPGEVEGRDYFFMSDETFRNKVAAGEFIEYADVHGRLYGTLKAELAWLVGSGKDIVLELDTEGAENVKRLCSDSVLIFIAPPTFDELRKRLEARGTDSPEQIEVRLETAREEMELTDMYDHIVVNDVLDQAAREVKEIIASARREASGQER
jgi:guanylate kinase